MVDFRVCFRLSLCVCVCVCVPLLRLISLLLSVGIWSNLVKMLELWSDWLYRNFIKIGLFLTLLWRHCYFFSCFWVKKLCSKGHNPVQRETIMLRKAMTQASAIFLFLSSFIMQVSTFTDNIDCQTTSCTCTKFCGEVISKTRSIQRTQTPPRLSPLTCDVDLMTRSKTLKLSKIMLRFEKLCNHSFL